MASSLGFSELNSNESLSKIKNQKHTFNGKRKITIYENIKLIFNEIVK